MLNMKLSFKNFWGETFMLIPNINFWSDDDPEYAPHKYMFFIGWLWWGWRFYFGKAEENYDWGVRLIYNKHLDKSYYVIVFGKDPDVWNCMTRDNFNSLMRGVMCSEADSEVIGCASDLEILPDRKVLAFDNIEDAFAVKDIIERAEKEKDDNRWQFLPPYQRMYLSRNGV